MKHETIKPIKSKCLRYLKSFLYLGKKVGFWSNFGHGDIGDDTFLFEAEKLFRKKLLPVSKRCYAYNPSMYKVLLIGGGAPLRWEAPYIPRRLLKAQKINFPVVLFSLGINCDYGHDYTEETKEKIMEMCSKADYITARDNFTKNFLTDLGVKDINILPDLELMLEPAELNLDVKQSRKTVGIVLTPHSAFDNKQFSKIENLFVEYINYLDEIGFDVLIIPFDDYNVEDKKESELIKSIVDKVDNKEAVQVLANNLSHEQLLACIKEKCHVMTCMRMHSAVFSLNAAVPFYCISYNYMHKALMEEINLAELELPLDDIVSVDTMKNKFNYLLDNYESVQKTLEMEKSRLRGLIIDQCKYISENYL